MTIHVIALQKLSVNKRLIAKLIKIVN